jgi:N-hydroxyarylamine O-acetyltransferase
MEIDAYLRRIGLAERPSATLAGLAAVHRAHLLAVPYENFDVQLGRPVTTAIPAIYDKIVTRRRGGWCYEMNGILGWALGVLGFRVTRATGAVMRAAAGDAVVGNHLVLRVELDEGTYLADVGFGDGALEPFAVCEGAFSCNGFPFSVARADGDWWRLHNHPAGGAPSFDFHLAPADETVLAAQCAGLQTSGQSPFVQNAIAFRHVDGGYHVLRGRTLALVRPDGAERREIADAGDLVATLQRDFALDLPEAASLWDKISARHDQVMAEKAAATASQT